MWSGLGPGGHASRPIAVMSYPSSRIDDPAQSMGPNVAAIRVVTPSEVEARGSLGLVRGLACRLVMAPEPGPGRGGAGAPVRPGDRVGRVGPSYVRLLRGTGCCVPRSVLPRLRLGFGEEPGPRWTDRV